MAPRTANAIAPGPAKASGKRAARDVSSPVRPVLDRGEVMEIQRARIVGAISELVRERGGTGVSVAHIVARSGISRRTFYELFADREECFIVAFDRSIHQASGSVTAAYGGAGSWRERTRAALAAILAYFDAEPDRAYLCVVGALGGGPRALRRRAAVLQALVAAVHEGAEATRRERRPDALVAEAVVGAVLAVVHARMLEGDTRPLAGLLNPLMAMIVLPYLGTAAGERERARPEPPPARRPVRPHADPLRNLDMRLTYRTVRVLLAIAEHPQSNNRQVSQVAGVSDQGQISKLLMRLQKLGLIHSTRRAGKGEPNAWTLTERGEQVAGAVDTQAPRVGGEGFASG
jgi:AcrR family transcriptional regulator